MKRKLTPMMLAIALPAVAGELPVPLQAKFVKILCGSAGGATKVASKDASLNAEIAKIGLEVDAGSKVAWATSEGEVAAYKGAGKMVIVSKIDLLPKGGSVAVVEEGGKPQIYLNMGNIAASGVTISDTILKIGKQL